MKNIEELSVEELKQELVYQIRMNKILRETIYIYMYSIELIYNLMLKKKKEEV